MLRIVSIAVTLISACALAATTPHAQDGATLPPADTVAVPGANVPAFAATLENWLADDDEHALPAFAALAAEGNAAAGILLALIDRMPQTHGSWLVGRTPAQRRALMRAPDGGTWLDAAGADAPLAALWRALWAADTDPEVAFAFADIGEHRAARLTLLAHASRQRGGFAGLARDPRYPPELAYLAWIERPDDPETRGALESLEVGDPQATRIAHDMHDDEALADWLATAPLAAPIAAFCADACGADAPACRLDAYRALGGYRGLFALGPPSEILIPPETWAASLRGAREVPRRIALLRPPRLESACLERAVAFTP